jgi:phosphopantetheinyl transferase
MPLFYQQNINYASKLAIWKIDEPESFFLDKVILNIQVSHPHKRLQHLAGRYILPYLYPDFPYHEILIADTRKPFLQNEMYHFSISHCGQYAAAIVSSELRVGIDIEIITERLHKIKHKYLSKYELEFVMNFNAADQIKILTILWSAKEAMFKWYGKGNVDFDKMMLIEPFNLSIQGGIQATFIDLSNQFQLQLQYKLLDDLCLVWVMNDWKK